MSPDDPRHGTHRGYIVGCRDDCCRIAHTRYMKLYRMGRCPHMVDPTGTKRRIQALLALGWTCKDIGQRCQRGDEWARMVFRSRVVTSETAFLVAKAYDQMCMTVPTGAYFYTRNRRLAQRKGYLPPLAWDDIDDPSERPDLTAIDAGPDPVVVQRILSGDWRLRANAAERAEVIERWTGGRNELERLTGWNIQRDLRTAA